MSEITINKIAEEYNLKPCPFCIHRNFSLKRRDGNWFVHCDQCDTVGITAMSKGGAVNWWNRRRGVILDQEFYSLLYWVILESLQDKKQGVSIIRTADRNLILGELQKISSEQVPPDMKKTEREEITPLLKVMEGAEMVIAASTEFDPLDSTQGIFQEVFAAIGEELQFSAIEGTPRDHSLAGRAVEMMGQGIGMLTDYREGDVAFLRSVLEMATLAVGTLMEHGIVRRGTGANPGENPFPEL
jgi:hypothetical protein